MRVCVCVFFLTRQPRHYRHEPAAAAAVRPHQRVGEAATRRSGFTACFCPRALPSPRGGAERAEPEARSGRKHFLIINTSTKKEKKKKDDVFLLTDALVSDWPEVSGWEPIREHLEGFCRS